MIAGLLAGPLQKFKSSNFVKKYSEVLRCEKSNICLNELLWNRRNKNTFFKSLFEYHIGVKIRNWWCTRKVPMYPKPAYWKLFWFFFKRQWEDLNCTTQEIDFLPIFAGELNKTCLNCLICRSWSVSLNINDRQKINIIYRTQAWMKNVSSIVQFYKNIVVCLR